MVKLNITSRLFTINTLVTLTQTDTTVGFLSQDAQKLKEIKSRESSKPFILVYKNFRALKNDAKRVPKAKKRAVRRAKRTTFIVKNLAFRIAKDRLNSQILRATQWNYSTSANESGKSFELEFCEQKADIIVQNREGLHEGQASSLLKINNKKTVRLR